MKLEIPIMPPRPDELPEGTDHIINGAMETSGSARAAAGGGLKAGFVASGATGDTGGSAGGSATGGVAGQLRGQVSELRDQAGERIRDFAQSGKGRATDALDELSKVVGETAETIDERLGAQYGEYARKAADAVATFSDTLRRKEVDELYEDVREAVRKSPAVAVGIAAVVGFTLVRLVKAGLEDDRGNRSA